MQIPVWQPTLCVALCLIWLSGHAWHQMSLLRPGVIKQHKPNQTSIQNFHKTKPDCVLVSLPCQILPISNCDSAGGDRGVRDISEVIADMYHTEAVCIQG